MNQFRDDLPETPVTPEPQRPAEETKGAQETAQPVKPNGGSAEPAQPATQPTAKHKPTKLTRHRVPPPQRVRIMQKYVAGESIVEISREEKRNPETLTKIVRSSEMQDFVRQMREEFYGLAFDAIAAVRYALQVQKDGRIAYQLLRDIGVIHSPEERAQAAMQQRAMDGTPLTPFQKAMLGSAAIMEQTCEVYGAPLPDMKEMEHNLRISREIDRMTGVKNWEISNYDGMEFARLKKLAEDLLSGKRGLDDPEIVAVREQYGAESR